jgi:branched-chain amino acid transport system permease protein
MTMNGPATKTLGVVALVTLIAALAAAPLFLSAFHTFQLSQIIVLAIALLGLNLLTGWSGQISLGHGAFFAVGAYTVGILLAHDVVPYWAAIPLAGVAGFVTGLLFGLPAVRLEGIYLALATFALAVATPQILKLGRLEPWTGGVQGIVLDKPDAPFELPLDADQWLYFVCLLCAVVLFLGAWNLVRGRSGRALVALRDHPIAAATMGIDTARTKLFCFAVSAGYTALAGGLGALVAGFVSPDSFTIFLSIDLFVGVVVGGLASILPMLFGAAFVQFLPTVASQLSDAAPGAIYGGILITFMILMPRGLAGLAHKWRRGPKGA